jgi:hypothetical protein
MGHKNLPPLGDPDAEHRREVEAFMKDLRKFLDALDVIGSDMKKRHRDLEERLERFREQHPDE